MLAGVAAVSPLTRTSTQLALCSLAVRDRCAAAPVALDARSSQVPAIVRAPLIERHDMIDCRCDHSARRPSDLTEPARLCEHDRPQLAIGVIVVTLAHAFSVTVNATEPPPTDDGGSVQGLRGARCDASPL